MPILTSLVRDAVFITSSAAAMTEPTATAVVALTYSLSTSRSTAKSELFTAIARLPDTQFDVMVLRYMCGFTPEEASDLLGVPLATVRSTERHAHRFLADTIEPPATEGLTP